VDLEGKAEKLGKCLSVGSLFVTRRGAVGGGDTLPLLLHSSVPVLNSYSDRGRNLGNFTTGVAVVFCIFLNWF